MVLSPLDAGRDTRFEVADPFVLDRDLARSTRLAARKSATERPKKKKKKTKKHPVCTAKDLKTKGSKRRKCRVVRPKATAKVSSAAAGSAARLSPTGAVAAPPAAAPTPDAFPTIATSLPVSGLVKYTGTFGVAEATRLLYRAGFGPAPGQAEALAALGVRGAVDRLLSPGAAQLVGPAPTGDYLVGGELAPADKYGHLHLAMLDRQVRSTDQLGERMTLILHDWFAVSVAGAGVTYMPRHIDLLRRGWRGSFRQLLMDITQDPAMLAFLDGVYNQKAAPNENYAREVMELYALGADRGAYTETDVREMARALTGFCHDYSHALGSTNFRYEPLRHDDGLKTVFAGTSSQRTGNLGWQDAINAIVDHAMHPSFVVRKLWSYFIPTEPAAATQTQLEALYRSSGEQLAPLISAILVHPDLYQGPSMVKPPVVYAAGLLRATRQGLSTVNWAWRLDAAGQFMGFPPSVAGWNDRAWLNTSTHSARWGIVTQINNGRLFMGKDFIGKTESPTEALASALAWLGNPWISDALRAAALRICELPWARGDTQYGSIEFFYAHRQNTLRHMLAASPDSQVC